MCIRRGTLQYEEWAWRWSGPFFFKFMMMRKLLIVIIFCAIAFGIYLSRVTSESLRSEKRSVAEHPYLTLGKHMKHFTLGFDTLVVDLFWLQAIQYVGGKESEAEGYASLYPLLDIVTDIDNKFLEAYEFGGIILSFYAKKLDEGNTILEKGIKFNPEYWRLPFWVGFNYFYYMGDFIKAAEYIKRASLLPGHPVYLPGLASRLYIEANNPDGAIEFLQSAYENTSDKRAREQIANRIKEVTIERDILQLVALVRKYKDRYKRMPDSLADLLKKNVIKSIPEEPFGGYYYLDPKEHTVKSNTHPKRLRIYGHTGVLFKNQTEEKRW